MDACNDGAAADEPLGIAAGTSAALEEVGVIACSCRGDKHDCTDGGRCNELPEVTRALDVAVEPGRCLPNVADVDLPPTGRSTLWTLHWPCIIDAGGMDGTVRDAAIPAPPQRRCKGYLVRRPPS